MRDYKFNKDTDKDYLARFSSRRYRAFVLLENLYKTFINDKDGRVDFIVKYIFATKPKKILEIGSGILPIYQFLPKNIKRECEYNICEINRKKVTYLLKKYSSFEDFLKIKCSDVFPLPYPDNYFDFVLSKGVFHHIDDIDSGKRREKKIAFLNEIRRVLKDKGINLLMDFFPEKKIKDIFWHKMYRFVLFEGDYNYLNKLQARELFELTGYKDIKLYDLDTFKGLYYNVIAKK